MALGFLRTRLLPFVALALVAVPARANSTAQTLPFAQNWTNTGLITVNDDWSGVPGIEGFRGDGLTAANDVDAQTVLVADAVVGAPVVDVNANQANPSTFATGGVAEFQITNPVVALQGSGTADAPYLRVYLDTTGKSNVTVHYRLRDVDGSTDNAPQQVALHYRVGDAGSFSNVAAAYVADASSGPSLATLETSVCAVLPAAVDNQALVELRILTTNASGNDEWIGIDDLAVDTLGCIPTLSINDVAVTEGDAGTVTASFTVSVLPALATGDISFDVATADGTAQDDVPATEDNDYVASALPAQVIPANTTTYTFDVTVNGDTAFETNETFFVNLTNISATGPAVPSVADAQGQGTINNDDVQISLIHDVQGPGASSPLVGGSVTVRGLVTGRRSNGFFVQEEEADYDADPATSEGILVFTGGAPPAGAVVGALVQVTGTVAEFVPSADPLQPPLTELTAPSVIQVSTGNPLPAPVALTAAFPSPAGTHDQLERLEGMRVSVASLTVVSPTLGTVNETNATATSNGVFYGVVTGVARPFREAGIQAPDPAPAGSIPPIPRFDSNPERIRVDSDGLVGGPLTDVKSGDLVLGLVGPLDYTFRTYSILPDPPGAFTVVDGGRVPTAVAVPLAREFTLSGYNLERFFDTVNDPDIGDPVLTAAAFDQRLAKASLGIRDFLRSPDILGVIEVENLTTLQALAARISVDAIAAGQPDPAYDAYLVEGNDVGGIDVGFLVKTALVDGVEPRVEVVSVTQVGAATLFTNPDTSTELLNDRPPLVLEAVVHHANGASFPIVAIVVHQRSLNGVNDPRPGANGWATTGERVRAKRLAQAEFLAGVIDARQIADASERLVVVGDFNAFEVNDGLVDAMGVADGTPVPDNETAVPGDGVDLVDPDLDNLFDTPPAGERYSYLFDGNAQSLDHVLVNEDLAAATVARRIEHPRINADYPETARNSTVDVLRLSDHDPAVAYFEVLAFATADLSIAKVDSVDPVAVDTDLAYTITVANTGPDTAASVAWSDPLPAGTTFVSLTWPAGWSCATPAVGAGGTVSCSIASLPVGSAAFTLTVHVGTGFPGGTVLSNSATVASTTADPSTANNSEPETTTLLSPAAVTATKSAAGAFIPGSLVTYTVALANAGPATQSDNPGDEFVDLLPAELGLQSASATSGTALAETSTNTVTWNGSIPPGGSVTITIVAVLGYGVEDGQVIANQGTAYYDADGNGTNEAAAATDDPETGDAGDPTEFVVSAASIQEIPTLDGLGLALLALALAALAARRLRRAER